MSDYPWDEIKTTHPDLSPEGQTVPAPTRTSINDLCALSRKLIETDPTRSLELAQQASELSQANQYRSGLARSLTLLSIHARSAGNYETALQQALEGFAIFQDLGDPLHQGQALISAGRTHWYLGNYADALECSFQALRIYQESGNPWGEVEAFSSLLLIYVDTGNYAEATTAGLKALEVNRSMLAAMKAEGKFLDWERAFYAREARLLVNLANAYVEWKHYPEGLARAQEGLQLCRRIGYRAFEGYALLNMADPQAHLGQVAEAVQCLEQSLAIGRELDDSTLEIYSLFYLSELYEPQDPNRARECLQLAVARAEATGQKAHAYRCHAALAKIYESQQDWRRALTHYKQFHFVQETVFNDGSDRKIKSLLIGHQAETARKEALIYQLRNVELEQAYHALQTNQQRLLAVEKMAAIGRLTAGLAHDLNTPMAAVRSALVEFTQWVDEYETAIQDPNALAADHLEIAQDMEQTLQQAGQSVEQAVQFVNSINAQTREAATQTRRHFNVVTVLEELVPLLKHVLLKGNCILKLEAANRDLTLYGSPELFARVVMNLLTNAVEASARQGGGPIMLRLAQTSAGLELEVSDLGGGIPKENLTRIFDPLFTTKPFGEASGLGLTIVHDIVTGEFGGTIAVESQLAGGTTFTLLFPITVVPAELAAVVDLNNSSTPQTL